MTKKKVQTGTNLEGKIVVGMRGNAHTNLQCLQALGTLGFHAVLALDAKTGDPTVSLFKGDELKRAASGATYPVALRRLFEGASEMLPDQIIG